MNMLQVRNDSNCDVAGSQWFISEGRHSSYLEYLIHGWCSETNIKLSYCHNIPNDMKYMLEQQQRRFSLDVNVMC